MTIDMSQFFQVFFDETEEQLAEMERLLLAIDVSSPDSEDLNAIFRAAHSIKGGAGTFGFADLIDVTHVLETLLDKIRKNEMPITAEHVDAFLQAKDVLKMQLDGHRLKTAVDTAAVAVIRSRLERLALTSQHGTTQVLRPVDLPPQRQGMRLLSIRLPIMDAGERSALLTELALIGTATGLVQGPNGSMFVFHTNESDGDILSICSFLIDKAQVGISDFTLGAAGGAALARDEQATQEDKQGYGFFDNFELRGDADQTHHAPPSREQIEAVQGYGFFEPFVPKGSTGTAEQHAPDADEQGHPLSGLEEKKAPIRRDSDRTAAHSEASSIRVSVEKVDQLINLVGELVITQAMIEQRADELDPVKQQRLINSIAQLTRNTRDLQESVMSIRMMPMDYVFSRFPRMVRDLAAKLGKKVEFVTNGAATELDKGLIERIIDPLTHLVRNSVDHGIEMPAQRVAAGKSETGRLSLSATHQGGNIIIEVTDDGGGLHRDRILAKAREQGLAAPNTMTDPEVWNLIFAPGFSTAEVVTDISGRGVGMDVVKRNITAMGGSVEIRSMRDFGTTIAISLPLTLAILDGMSVRVGEEIYILPLGYVIESLQPTAADVKEISGQGRVLKVRGEYLPLIALHEIFGITPRHTDPTAGIVVILESDGRRAGLFLDDLVGQQQIVVKNLESNYRKVDGISGATILGDGGVSLIIDVAALLRSRQDISNEVVAIVRNLKEQQ